jgi:preprotein translocase subunit SecF
MFVVTYRKIFFILSGFFVALSLGAILLWGLNLGIEFTGGALTEVRYSSERPAETVVEQELNNLAIGNYSLRTTDVSVYLLRSRDLSDAEQSAVIGALSLGGTAPLTVERLSSIGPTLGSELRIKALIAIVVVMLAIVLYIAYTFRHVSKPVASWKYGLIAILALVHNIILPLGLFAVLGKFFGSEIDVLFVVALLTILGSSVNDTIVVFDRVRENLKESQRLGSHEDFELTVGKSLKQTYMRSINISIAILLVLLALFFLGAATTQDFSLALLVGIIAGTYSSIFLATPLLVTIEKWQSRSKRA